jgi:hypothetical protein
MHKIGSVPFFVREDDASYYRTRALQEQVAAQKATCEAARTCHDQLAAIYRFRALMLSGAAFQKHPVELERTLEPVG